MAGEVGGGSGGGGSGKRSQAEGTAWMRVLGRDRQRIKEIGCFRALR